MNPTNQFLAPFICSAFFLTAPGAPRAMATPPDATNPDHAAISFAEIGAKATVDYQGDALAVTATSDGARLRCGFQKLEGRATAEGLWLTSIVNGGGKLRLVASSFSREALECGSPPPRWLQADLFQSGVGTVADPSRSGASVQRRHSLDSQSAALCRDAATGPWLAYPLAPTGTVQVADKLVRLLRPGLTEEYSVSVEGVRQDFVIESPPLDAHLATHDLSVGEMRLELALSGAHAEPLVNGVRLTLEGSGRKLAYTRLRATDAMGKELPARMEVVAGPRQSAAVGEQEDGGALPTCRYARLAVVVDDADAIYPVRIDPTFSDENWVSMSGWLGANGYVGAAAVDGSGNLYIGGKFTMVGNIFATNIAEWNGTTWSSLGAGVEGDNAYNCVSALAVSGSDLYVGGTLTNAGGSAANYVAKWNGSRWAPLGSGLNGSVSALAVSGTDLYVGGAFTMAGDSAASGIAKWNGSSWSPLGIGVAGTYPYVRALAVLENDLYAGGAFKRAGFIEANGIAKWDGSNWSELGAGVNNYVAALAVSGTNLYVGGEFKTAGGVAATNVAKWNGGSWSPLGAGIWGKDYHQVTALAVSGSDLYVGGSFETAGSSAATNVAKWNGSSWSPLGSGLDGGVTALAASGSDRCVGGAFTTASGSGANYVAKWDGSSWSALGSGLDSVVNALAVFGNDLYVGGWFTTAGGRVSAYLAQANPIPQRGVIHYIGAGGGAVALDCQGLPGNAYAVERATDVQLTADLMTLLTTNAPAPDGLFRCTDSSPPSTTAFYRLRRQ